MLFAFISSTIQAFRIASPLGAWELEETASVHARHPLASETRSLANMCLIWMPWVPSCIVRSSTACSLNHSFNQYGRLQKIQRETDSRPQIIHLFMQGPHKKDPNVQQLPCGTVRLVRTRTIRLVRTIRLIRTIRLVTRTLFELAVQRLQALNARKCGESGSFTKRQRHVRLSFKRHSTGPCIMVQCI